MSRQNILSGSPWEDKMGYCRAVRIGNIIEVAGTVAIVDGEKVKADDAFAQTHNIRFDDIARAHGSFFGDIKPTTGIYEISALVSPDYLVEIEFTAVLA
jgi:enamine deaminase RidA (YjgF/YER057c/UK114 family)